MFLFCAELDHSERSFECHYEVTDHIHKIKGGEFRRKFLTSVVGAFILVTTNSHKLFFTAIILERLCAIREEFLLETHLLEVPCAVQPLPAVTSTRCSSAFRQWTR